MTTYRALSHTPEDSFTVLSWQIQVEQDDVWAGYGAGVDLVDVTKHRLPIPVAGKGCVDVVMFERFLDEKDVCGVVLDEDDVQFAARLLRS